MDLDTPSPPSPFVASREATPSSSSAHSTHSTGMGRTVSSGPNSIAGSSISQGIPSTSSATSASQDEGFEKIMNRLSIERAAQQLRDTLTQVSVKAGLASPRSSVDFSAGSSPQPPSRRRSQVTIVPPSPSSAPHPPYEPPSPSRPPQLIDVLWQPLPPPSHLRSPGSSQSPYSPGRKRSHDDSSPHPYSPAHGYSPHRRASSSAAPYPPAFARHGSPLRTSNHATQLNSREEGKKKRSQSHSQTTRQDVDAAKALTFMLGSGSPRSESGSKMTRTGSMQAPPVPAYPPAFTDSPDASSRSVQRRASGSGPISPSHSSFSAARSPLGAPMSPTSSRSRSTIHSQMNGSASAAAAGGDASTDRGEDDKKAAELMMFLAHSPSPMRRDDSSSSHSSVSRLASIPARVLFSEPTNGSGQNVGSGGLGLGPPVELEGAKGAEVRHHSNLVLADPITPASLQGVDVFGAPLRT